MTRYKGFERDFTDQDIMQGAMHQPDMSGLQNAHVANGENVDAQRDALDRGIPIIDEAFSSDLQHAQTFEAFTAKTIERSRSAHGVSFGRFVGWVPHRDEKGTVLSVALKPFDSPEKALREFHGYRKLGELMVESFEPVGIFPSNEGSHYIAMTKSRKDLMSLDRDDWVVGMRVNDETSSEIVARNIQTVIDIAGGLAYIHTQGVFHPDGQIKNWAMTPEGQVGIIDTEHLRSEELGNTDAADMAWNDIEKLIKSLVLDDKHGDSKMFGVGMLAHMPLAELRQKIEQFVITPYMDTLLMMSDSNQSPAQEEQIRILFEGIVHRFYEDEQWPQHFIDMQHGYSLDSDDSDELVIDLRDGAKV